MKIDSERAYPLKIAVLSSASRGGAGIAARRVHEALSLSREIAADFIDMDVLGGRIASDSVPRGSMSNRRISDTHFTVEFPGFVRGWVIDLLRGYDVLNIHWTSSLLGIAEIDELSRLGLPILFTSHDYYYFTGGCHYPATCEKLAEGCIGCPQVDQRRCSRSVVAQNLKVKARILDRPNVHLSAPSRFLINEATNVGMIAYDRAHVLRNPYSPVPGVVRTDRSGPQRIVLMADSMAERRKAMPLAIDSLSAAYRHLRSEAGDHEPFVVEVIGNADSAFKAAVRKAGFPYRIRGGIEDHTQIAELLRDCDFLLTCSLEDNWPNVLVEAAAYGVIPVVGPGHGCEEFVSEFGIGSVAKDYNVPSFVDALVNAIQSYGSVASSILAEAVLKAHVPEYICAKYLKVFNSIMVVNKNEACRADGASSSAH